MTKSELAASVASKSGLTKKNTEKALNAFFASVEQALVNGDTVQVIGFGTFEAKKRAARKGRNPKTGAEIEIKASRVPTFKPGKALKEAVNK